MILQMLIHPEMQPCFLMIAEFSISPITVYHYTIVIIFFIVIIDINVFGMVNICSMTYQ